LMCAIHAARRHNQVLVLDHSGKAGQKLLVSGGGQCNFTNRFISADHYISQNPDFCRSALSRFSPQDFIDWVASHHIHFHERDHGQLFCDDNSRLLLDALLKENKQAGVVIQLHTQIEQVKSSAPHQFVLHTSRGLYGCRSLVIATGGLSMPKLGASSLGYQIAGQFGLNVVPPRAGLVPFTLQPKEKALLSTLSGIAINAEISTPLCRFRENLLFTHRGLSGPVALQASSYWQPGEEITINLLPGIDLMTIFRQQRQTHPQRQVQSVMTQLLPRRLVEAFANTPVDQQSLRRISTPQIEEIAQRFQSWQIKPGGTEGYRTAEVTVGGVDCHGISSKTFEAYQHPGLYFIGEVLDVTGWLGGYNLQWAWSSGWCAGQFV
ncbi:MAG: NAD(P)/FAD-dependent oxidoreductase, partial [Calditrichaeota bacterium]